MNLQLHGKVALVTGASRGIGAAITAELAEKAITLCFVARDSAKLQEVGATIKKTANIQVLFFRLI